MKYEEMLLKVNEFSSQRILTDLLGGRLLCDKTFKWMYLEMKRRKDIICRGTSLSKDLDLNMCRLFSGSGKY